MLLYITIMKETKSEPTKRKIISICLPQVLAGKSEKRATAAKLSFSAYVSHLLEWDLKNKILGKAIEG